MLIKIALGSAEVDVLQFPHSTNIFPAIWVFFGMRWLTYTSLSIAVEDKLHVAGTFGAMVRLLADVLAASIAVVARHYQRRQE